MLKLYNLFLFAIGLNKPIQFNTGLPYIINRVSNYINKKYIENPTNLHRWCHKQSDKYRDSCNWETKLDNANIDNSL
jgi:hypothetical protein